MKMLDTNICSYIIRGMEPYSSVFRAAPSNYEISSIVAIELERWLGLEATGEALRDLIQSFLDAVNVVPFEREAATHSAGIIQNLKQSNADIGCFDPLIAGHALALKRTLITNNEQDFRRVPSLRTSARL